MEGFKVLYDSKQPRSAHLRAKCAKTGRDILIRLEYEKAAWWLVYASEAVLPQTGADGSSGNEFRVTFENGLHTGDDYACPCCKSRRIVSCGSCGRITCWDGGKFTCGHCGNSGEVTGTIKSAQAEKHLPNGKK